MSAPKAEAAGLTVERREELGQAAHNQIAGRSVDSYIDPATVLALLDALAAAEAERDKARAAVVDAWDEGWWKGRNDDDPTVIGYADNPYRAALDTASSEGA